MKITCHACDAKYTIADEKVTGRTVKIKCKKCGATIVVNADPGAAAAPAYGEPQPQAHAPNEDELMATRVAGADMGGPSVTTADWTVSVTGEDERQMSQLQIAEELQRGVVTADTYVWRDGMTDWLPLGQVPELAALVARTAAAAPQYAAPQYAAPQYAAPAEPAYGAPAQDEPGMGLAGTMIMNDAPAPSPFAAPRPAAGMSPYAPPAALAPVAASPALASVSQPTSAARRANRAGGGVDVFAAAAESKEAAGPPRPPPPAGMRGERNENSVLFSLSALTASEGAASRPSAKSDDAVLDLGFGRGNANGKNDVNFDLMNIGGGAIGGPMLAPPPLLAPVVEPPPQAAPAPVVMTAAAHASMAPGAMPTYGIEPQPKSKKGLIIGIVAAVVVVGGIGAVFALGGSSPSADATPSATPTVAATTPSATPTVASADTSAAPATTEAPAASGAPAASSAAVAVSDSKTPSSGGGGPAPTPKASASASAKASADPVPTPSATPTPTEAPPAGRDFNKGAATTALSGAAGAAKGCKQPGGPTGSASVRVVFAPSGNVTSANVQGPPFAGTPVGGCIASAFRGARIPAFDGSPVAVSKTVNIN